jgi:hypothetical protein
MHIEVTDPAGQVIGYYSGNSRAPDGVAIWEVPFAYSDVAGTWKIGIRDLLSGAVRTAEINVL